jgi:hypothetical protein
MNRAGQWPIPVRTALLRVLKELLKQLTWAVPVWVVVFGSYAAFWWYRDGSTTHAERLTALVIPLLAVFVASVSVALARVSRFRKSGQPPIDAEPSWVTAPIQVGFCFMILFFGIVIGSTISLDAAPASVLLGKVGVQLIGPIFFAAVLASMSGLRRTSLSDTAAKANGEHRKQ